MIVFSARELGSRNTGTYIVITRAPSSDTPTSGILDSSAAGISVIMSCFVFSLGCIVEHSN